jgi:hypothetical protein
MVGWYDPAQLIRTAGQVIVSMKLPRFGGHPSICVGGVQDGQNENGLCA